MNLKLTTLITAALFLLFRNNAQAQIPNASFENWTGTISHPTSWDSYDDLAGELFSLPADSLDLCRKDSTPANVYAGSASVRLKTDALPQVGITAAVLTSNTLGFDQNQGSPILTGWAYTGRPVTFNYAAKYQPVTPRGDTAGYNFQLTKWDATGDSEILVGLVYTNVIYDTHGSFVTRNDSITYLNTLTPDTMTIFVFSSAGNNIDSTNIGSTLWLDDLSLTSAATGIAHFDMDDAVKVFPNPASQQLNITIDDYLKGSTLQIFDATGRMVQQMVVENNSTAVNLNGLSNGNYIYRLLTKTQQVNQGKFVIVK